MNENKQGTNKEFTEEERRQKVFSICKFYEERFEEIGDDWEKLNKIANEVFAEADRSLSKKRYKSFAMHLRMYSWIWVYASDHLDPVGYLSFCAGQDPAVHDRAM